MAESKKKPDQAGLREPKPKKKLGLTVPQALRMPHEDLFPSETATSQALQLVTNNDQPSEPTSNPVEPVVDFDQSKQPTSNNRQPDTINDQQSRQTGEQVVPVANNNRPPEATGNPNQPATTSNQQLPTTSRQQQPAIQQDQSLPNAGQQARLVGQQPVELGTLSATINRSSIATSRGFQPATQPNEYRQPKDEYFLTPNSVSDEVQQALTDEQFCVYFRLFRLSHGFKQTTCFVGYNSLAKALNWKVWKVKKVMPELLATGYVRIVESYNGQGLKGTVYEVFTSRHLQPEEADGQSPSKTSRIGQPNKHDHDDPIKQNPHQSAVMRIYGELTGNEWTKADGLQYQKLTGLTADEIELHMRAIHGRAASRIGSLAYFVKGIEQALSQGGQPSQSTLETQYRQIAREIAAAWVGGSRQPSEWVDRLKWRCAQEGLPWNNDIANKALGF